MTEISRYQEPVAVAATSQDLAVHRLMEWAESAQAAHQVAITLVETSFCPNGFRGKAGEATAAILAGLEVGIAPMAALRSFDIIQNQAAPRAITLRAIVQSQGHSVELVESTSTRCVMRGRRKGSDTWQKVTWTMDRAKELGLTSKDSWKKQPIAMLQARATSEICRLIAADAILGLPYSSEEVVDGVQGDVDSSAATTEPAQQTTRRMSYTPDAEVEPEPTQADVEAARPDPRLLTAAQSKMLHALLNEVGCGERSAGLLYISEVVGRDIGTSKDLTRDEASRVIDQATADKEAAAAQTTIEDVETGELL